MYLFYQFFFILILILQHKELDFTFFPLSIKLVMSREQNSYIDLKNNGRLFPSWVLHNFKKYKLPKILRTEGVDPCKRTETGPSAGEKLELRKYQEFMGQYLNPLSPYNEILLYHGLGSGKTATSINLMNIMYNYDHNMNVIILIKASLHNDPWMMDLKKWLGRDPSEEGTTDVKKLVRFKTIHFVHYDSPFADKSFLETMMKIDTSKPTVYIIDEAHNFIRNVYSNIYSKKGKRAQIIYDYIIKDRAENKNNKLILISATPGINTPFELVLMFNMLRPESFPSSEADFDRLFITESAYPILSPQKKNIFERRIMGLVSYYVGSTPDLFATQELKYINLTMSPYQYHIYRIFENLEAKIQKKAQRFGKSSQLYRTYTRQACNFVFPSVNNKISGELRPRPNAFKISEKTARELAKGSLTIESEIEEANREIIKKYMLFIEEFISETEKYFFKIKELDKTTGRTIQTDLDEFISGFQTEFDSDFKKFFQSSGPKSKLFTAMYDSSPKFLAIVFYSAVSPGKVMVYTNYVMMEGIDMLKVYFRLIGFNDYKKATESHGYCEYHGRMDPATRIQVKDFYNSKNNIYGTKCKVFLFSPSGAEGIQLYNIRQEHITEPYFTEVRILQVIGRGIRMCSHADLPQNERTVTVYRYKVIKPPELDETDTIKLSTDEIVEDLAKAKDNLIQSFLSAMREVAVDCVLFSEHNKSVQSYHCFKFPESAVTVKNIGPAYKENIKDDIKYDSGLHAKNTRIERIRVIKIQAVHTTDSAYSKPDTYWYYPTSGMVYDYETHYPVGQVEIIDNLPSKLDKNTYIITNVITIPTIVPTHNL